MNTFKNAIYINISLRKKLSNELLSVQELVTNFIW